VQSTPKAIRKSLSTLQETDKNIEILGTIVQVFDPRFYEVCPTCNKRAKLSDGKFICPTHNEVTPKYNFVMNVFLDDGTENMRIVFFSNQACNLVKKKHDEMLVFKDSPDQFDSIKTDLLGEIVKITGRVQKNDMFDRLEFIAQLVFPNPDPEQELKMSK